MIDYQQIISLKELIDSRKELCSLIEYLHLKSFLLVVNWNLTKLFYPYEIVIKRNDVYGKESDTQSCKSLDKVNFIEFGWGLWVKTTSTNRWSTMDHDLESLD